jgi:5-methylcytosine-specific restriction endonuclease McrA
MNPAPPAPEEQVRFLRNVQRLLSEGQFVASYKFALLRALADLAVLHGDDTGAALEIETRAIAERFVELYWRQARPFRAAGAGTGSVLQQNTGKQAAIINSIADAQAASGGSLFRFQRSHRGDWAKLLSTVDQTVRTMPLWRLQTVGEEPLEFLYANVGAGTKVTLNPGVAYCLRTFYELIRDLIEGAWIRYLQKVNADRLGHLTDLGTFLFGQERTSLAAYQPILFTVQKGTCIYCQKPLVEKKSQVDHFIPWSRYPADVGQNFVLAHDRCNNAKSDFIAAEEHLERWVERNDKHRAELEDRLRADGLPSDMSAARQIARWVYQQTELAKGQVWVEKAALRRLGSTWTRYL